jgi:hypothetical protein
VDQNSLEGGIVSLCFVRDLVAGLKEVVRFFDKLPVSCYKIVPAIFSRHELVDCGSCLKPSQQHGVPNAPQLSFSTTGVRRDRDLNSRFLAVSFSTYTINRSNVRIEPCRRQPPLCRSFLA